MIKTKEDLNKYLREDKIALNKKKKHPAIFGDEIWKFEIVLRKHEYHLNTHHKLRTMYYQYLHHRYSIKLGFQIPCNVIEEGLRINHFGLIVINGKCHIGKHFDVHQGVNIGLGSDGGVPQIGDNVFVGPGAKLFNSIIIGDNCMIGANSVINKSFSENSVVVGNPGLQISSTGNIWKW